MKLIIINYHYYCELVETPKMASQVNCSGLLNSVAKELEDRRVSLKDHRTAMLWLEYMKMVDILKKVH